MKLKAHSAQISHSAELIFIVISPVYFEGYEMPDHLDNGQSYGYYRLWMKIKIVHLLSSRCGIVFLSFLISLQQFFKN
jgi:hypothetical protein